MTTQELLRAAKQAAPCLAGQTAEKRNAALLAMAEALEDTTASILAANARDVQQAKAVYGDVMLDRLTLNEGRIRAMAEGVRQVAQLPDPIGQVLERTVHPNGMVIQKIAVPLGVMAIIFESRPNVVSDAAALAVKSGNAIVLRGGKEAWRSCQAVVEALHHGLERVGLPTAAIALVEDTTRQSAHELMEAVGLVDLLIPRGGAGLIRSCVEHAKVPCIQTGTGICHIYVDASAEVEKALRVVENAKCSRPSVCNAAEVLLVHAHIAPMFLPRLRQRLVEERRAQGLPPVELRLCPRAAQVIPGTPAGAMDFDTEFLDYILAVRMVDSVEEAIAHIAEHATGHSEAIITQDDDAALRFTQQVDAAAVYVNASTRFTDGGEFGLGCELGISTQKLHARGPMGLRALTTYKYVIHGAGQVR